MSSRVASGRATQECLRAIEIDAELAIHTTTSELLDAARQAGRSRSRGLKRQSRANATNSDSSPSEPRRIYIQQGRWWQALREFEEAAFRVIRARESFNSLRARLN